MIVAIDVQYVGSKAVTACILFENWDSSTATHEAVNITEISSVYVPGQFYLRELPCILEILGTLGNVCEQIIIDGYVWLGKNRPGMGCHLYQSLNYNIPVIGIAKKKFISNDVDEEILRGKSKQPLYITAEGIDIKTASAAILNMHGPHRIPSLIKRADQLCREHAKTII